MKVNLLFARLALVSAGFAGFLAQAQESGDVEWRHRAAQGAVTLAANPLRPAARAAFYEARGFTVGQIRAYSQSCGFSFGMQNGGKTSVSSRLADWRAVGADGSSIAFKLPARWDEEWEQAGVPPAARIAFKWAQFQTENVFEPGDWIMGMATLERAPAAPFRLVARYRDEKGNHEIVLDKLECARD